MDLKYYQDREKNMLAYPITIHWWNFGKKTLDFNGSLKYCLKEKDIIFNRIKHKTEDVIGYRFKYIQGSSKMTFDYWGGVEDGALKVIQFQLTYLGDKSQLYYMGRTRTVNF